MADADRAAPAARVHVTVSGYVQGVGFRDWVRSRAGALGLSGCAANLPTGEVDVVAEGSREGCEQLLQLLRGNATPGRVRDVRASWSQPVGDQRGFRIR